MRERKERKSKGSLSVLDEFTSDMGVGEIVFAPKANPEILKKIEEATRLADVPISSRELKKQPSLQANQTSSTDFKAITKPPLNDSVPPISNTLFFENNDNSGDSTQLNTTEHINYTQLNTNTNSYIEKENHNNQTQLDTNENDETKHNLTHENTNENSISSYQLHTTEHSVFDNKSNTLNTTEHKRTSSISKNNYTQLNTATEHKFIKSKYNGKFKGLTEHNQTQLHTQLNTTEHNNRTQLNTSSNTIFTNFLKQGGLRAKVLTFLYEEGLRQNSKNINLSYSMLANLTGVKTTSIKTTTKRLKDEGYIDISGPGGGVSPIKIFKLNDSLISSFILAKTKAQLNTTEHNNYAQLHTQLNTNPSSKLVSNNINNTNYLSKAEGTHLADNPGLAVSKVPSTWFKELDFSPVSPWSAMQVNSSIRNLVQEKLQPEQVQDFLNRFKSWLFAQQKVQNPLGMFCDKLKEFATEGDSAILNAMTDEDRELGVKFLEENQKIRTQIQLIEKANQERLRSQQENAKLEAEAEFEKWYASASDVELAQKVPPSSIAPLRSNLHKMSARSAFMQGFGLEV